jgi:hypothetical protein
MGSQREISTTEAISYLLNLLDHKIDHDFAYIPWLNLSAWVNEQEKNKNVQNENNNDTNVNYATFTIDKNSSNQQYIIHDFRINYQQIPTHFNYLCLYEFSSKINKINIHCHKFNNKHLQYNTHSLYEFKVPKNPVLQSHMIPSQKNDSKNYAQTICILFTSWRTIFDIKSHYILGNDTKKCVPNIY